MNAPVLTYSTPPAEPHGFAELDGVCLVFPITTDEGMAIPVGTEGTVVGVWAQGAAYEVEFADGLATVEAAHLKAA